MSIINNVLALDLGTKTGWAFGSALDPSVVISGWQDFSPGKFSGGGMRYLKFENWLGEIVAKSHATEVVYEGVRRHVGTDAAHVYGGLMATLTKFCEKAALPYAALPVQTIKKWATGKGNAPKAAMVAAVHSWGYTDVTSEDQADAIAILHCWVSTR